MKYLPLFTKTKGLSVITDNAEVDYSPSSGAKYLSEAVNVRISDTGKILRRTGYEQKAAGSYHGFFSYLDMTLAVSRDALYRINHDYSVTLVKSGLVANARYDYVGVNEEVYFVNGHDLGIVSHNGSFRSWALTSYVGPVRNRNYSQPPAAAHLVTYYNGRIYLAVDNAVFYSEPFFYAAFDYARNYLPFASRIRLLTAVSGGLFIGTEQEIFFVGGATPAEFQLTKVADYPPLINLASNDILDGQYLLDGQTFAGQCAIIPTTKGICIGAGNGAFRNISINTISYPSALYCSVLAQKDNILILINE